MPRSTNELSNVITASTHNADLLLHVVRDALWRYRVGDDEYDCRIEHTVAVMDAASAFIHTLASCKEGMSRDELFDKLIEKLQDARPPAPT